LLTTAGPSVELHNTLHEDFGNAGDMEEDDDPWTHNTSADDHRMMEQNIYKQYQKYLSYPDRYTTLEEWLEMDSSESFSNLKPLIFEPLRLSEVASSEDRLRFRSILMQDGIYIAFDHIADCLIERSGLWLLQQPKKLLPMALSNEKSCLPDGKAIRKMPAVHIGRLGEMNLFALYVNLEFGALNTEEKESTIIEVCIHCNSLLTGLQFFKKYIYEVARKIPEPSRSQINFPAAGQEVKELWEIHKNARIEKHFHVSSAFLTEMQAAILNEPSDSAMRIMLYCSSPGGRREVSDTNIEDSLKYDWNKLCQMIDLDRVCLLHFDMRISLHAYLKSHNEEPPQNSSGNEMGKQFEEQKGLTVYWTPDNLYKFLSVGIKGKWDVAPTADEQEAFTNLYKKCLNMNDWNPKREHFGKAEEIFKYPVHCTGIKENVVGKIC
jgi:hypothetical protein